MVTDLRARSLIADLEDMANELYDLTGDHETLLVSALTQFVSILGRGDKYLTLSTPAYWLAKTVGVNGRFLSMNKLAALNGATIRRVFVVTEYELENDQDLRKALTFHLDEVGELAQAGVRTDRSDIEAGGYYACVERVDADLQDAMVRQGKHFGLANQGYIANRALSHLSRRSDCGEYSIPGRRRFQSLATGIQRGSFQGRSS
jgi:hypothetical protein